MDILLVEVQLGWFSSSFKVLQAPFEKWRPRLTTCGST